MADPRTPQQPPELDPPLATEPDQATLAGAEQLLHLPRLQPPAGFADRVLARVGPAQTPVPAPVRRSHARLQRVGFALAAALALAVALPSLWLQHQREQQGRAAARQFELALRITQQQLNSAGERAATWHTAGSSRYVEPR